MPTTEWERTMANRRLNKQVEKLEEKADKYRGLAEEKAEKLSAKTSARAQDAKVKAEEAAEENGGRMGLFALVVAAIGGVAYFLKKRREQELDEALWEEPRSL